MKIGFVPVTATSEECPVGRARQPIGQDGQKRDVERADDLHGAKDGVQVSAEEPGEGAEHQEPVLPVGRATGGARAGKLQNAVDQLWRDNVGVYQSRLHEERPHEQRREEEDAGADDRGMFQQAALGPRDARDDRERQRRGRAGEHDRRRRHSCEFRPNEENARRTAAITARASRLKMRSDSL